MPFSPQTWPSDASGSGHRRVSQKQCACHPISSGILPESSGLFHKNLVRRTIISHPVRGGPPRGDMAPSMNHSFWLTSVQSGKRCSAVHESHAAGDFQSRGKLFFPVPPRHADGRIFSRGTMHRTGLRPLGRKFFSALCAWKNGAGYVSSSWRANTRGEDTRILSRIAGKIFVPLCLLGEIPSSFRRMARGKTADARAAPFRLAGMTRDRPSPRAPGHERREETFRPGPRPACDKTRDTA